MSGQSKDRILEACLEEILSGQSPPDLTDRVIRAVAAKQAAANGAHGQRSVAVPPPPAGTGQAAGGGRSSIAAGAATPAALERPIVAVDSSPSVAARLQRKKSNVWPLALIAAVAASVAVAVGIAWKNSDDAAAPIANVPANPQTPDAPPVVVDNDPPVEVEKPAPTLANDDSSDSEMEMETEAPVIHKIAPRVADSDLANDATSESPIATERTLNTPDAEVVAFINDQIRDAWKAAAVGPSPVAEDTEWCRRVYLDLLGRIPSITELNAYANDRSKDKKEKLVDELLNSDRYAEEYARNWTTIWTNILIGRTGGTGNNSLANREGMQQYLRRSFQRNKPYDRMVYELVSAEGAGRPGEEDYNGAVNFLVDNLQEDATTATAKTAKHFLGMQVQCTQCHNHPFNDWKQNQFWELNAFFRQARASRMGDGATSVGRLQDVDFSGESGRNPDEAEIYYELRNGTAEVAYPAFVDGTPIKSRSGRVSQVRRREELAKMIVASPYFGQAMVNRMWSHFLGYGFTKPIDDIGPHNAFTHQDLVQRLGTEFAGNGHDMKRLMRWIVLSEPYSLSSVYGNRYKNVKDDPSIGEKPLFSHFYLRQMEAEQLYQSLLVATEADKTQGSYEEQEKVKSEWLAQFAIAFGTDEGDEATTFNGTVPQVLMMMNGELVDRAVNNEPGSFLHRIVYENPNRAQSLEHLYLAALGRKPTRQEIQAANELLEARGGDPGAAMQDVWWALLNSGEFIFNR
jgi:hypothetical protein